MTRRYARPWIRTARDVGELALGFACLGFLAANNLYAHAYDYVTGQRGGLMPRGR